MNWLGYRRLRPRGRRRGRRGVGLGARFNAARGADQDRCAGARTSASARVKGCVGCASICRAREGVLGARRWPGWRNLGRRGGRLAERLPGTAAAVPSDNERIGRRGSGRGRSAPLPPADSRDGPAHAG